MKKELRKNLEALKKEAIINFNDTAERLWHLNQKDLELKYIISKTCAYLLVSKHSLYIGLKRQPETRKKHPMYKLVNPKSQVIKIKNYPLVCVMTDSFNNFFNQLLDEGQNAVSVSQNGVVKPVTLIHGIPVNTHYYSELDLNLNVQELIGELRNLKHELDKIEMLKNNTEKELAEKEKILRLTNKCNDLRPTHSHDEKKRTL